MENARYNDEFIADFYERFMSRSPAIARRFKNTNMSAQKTMLHDSLIYVVDYFLTEKVSDQLHHIARIHSKGERDIAPDLYDVWMDSLMETVRDFDPEYSKDVELAWRMALSPGITYMKFSYDQPG
jgi:hemoglobin-like flavoprotein